MDGPVIGPELLAREGRLLVERLRLWTPSRWTAAAPAASLPGQPYGGEPPSRADVAAHLIQAFADAVADQEGEPPRPVPRLGVLTAPDQLAVMVDDLVRTGPDEARVVRMTAHLLLHRTHLLGDEVPASLAVTLGADPLVLGERVCAALS